MSAPAPPSNARAVFLIALFMTLLGAVLVGFFTFLIGPAFIGVLAVMSGIGAIHYFLWGRSMENEVLAEAEAHDEPSPEVNGWPTDGPQPPRRF
jgi:hypothetical protein